MIWLFAGLFLTNCRGILQYYARNMMHKSLLAVEIDKHYLSNYKYETILIKFEFVKYTQYHINLTKPDVKFAIFTHILFILYI